MTEAEAILEEYARRERELPADRYAASSPGQLFTRHSRERITLDLLRRHGGLPLAGHRILDVGCGAGQWLVDMETWGADRSLLAGIDLIETRVARARSRVGSTVDERSGESIPGADVRLGDASALPWPDETFGIVVQSMVFSSVLDPSMRAAIAGEIVRVLAPGGLLLWNDFLVGNPRNPRVRGIRRAELRALFPGFDIDGRRALLPPPVARAVAPISPLAADLLQTVTLLNTQLVALLWRRPTQEKGRHGDREE